MGLGGKTEQAAGAPDADRSRWAALYVLCAGMLMIVLDATIVNVALPSIQADLGFSQSGLAWVVNGYLIAFGGLLLLSGRLGDLIGQRKVFLAGLGVFTTASAVCGIAGSQEVLIAARFIQGIGGALASAVILGMIVTMFPEPREQAKAIGVYGFVASAGGSIGLLLGGVLTEAISWHWIFMINVPIGVAVAFSALRLIPDNAGLGLSKGADVPGAAMLTGGLMVGVYSILGVTDNGWGATSTLVGATASIALIAGFVIRQGRLEQPLMPLRLFASRNVSGANLIQMLVVSAMFGLFFLGALYLGQVLGYGPLEVGLAFLPSTLAMGVMSLKLAEPLITRFGPRGVLLPSFVSLAAGLLLFARTPIEGSFLVDVLPATLLISIGAGASFPALMTLAMSDARPEDAGVASGLVNTSMQVGGAIGLAVLATLSASRTEGLVADGEAPLAALNSGFHIAYLIGAALMVVAAATAVFVLERPAQTGVEPDVAIAPEGGAPALAERSSTTEDARGSSRREPSYARESR